MGPTCWQCLANYVKNSAKGKKKTKPAFDSFQGSRQLSSFIPEIRTIIFNLSLNARLADSAFSLLFESKIYFFLFTEKLSINIRTWSIISEISLNICCDFKIRKWALLTTVAPLSTRVLVFNWRVPLIINLCFSNLDYLIQQLEQNQPQYEV